MLKGCINPLLLPEGDLEGGVGREGAPFFCNHLFFCNHFEELQTVLIAVKLIINNALLAYVYPNTIKTYLTLNHLLFGRQLLCYSHTTSTVVRNLTALSSTTDKINSINNHFWQRWRYEYEFIRDTTNIKIKYKLPKNYVALVYDEKMPRHLWRITIVQGYYLAEILKQKGAIVRIKKTNAMLKRLVNKFFPTEYTCHDTNKRDRAREQKLRWEAVVIGELKRKYDC